MSFPSSPSNNQTAIVNGITHVYYSSKNAWVRQQTSISSAGLDDYARTTANTATNNIVILQGVNTTQNTRLSVVEGGLISANANSAYLQGALNTANTNINTKFNSTGGTISGSVTISGNNDLIVTGNLIITGNISSQNVQQLTVADPLLVLGLGNYVSDTKDIGFASHYNDGANAHTGLIRDSGTEEYHFFTGYTPEVDASNSIDINHASFASANVNASTFKGNLIATTAVVGGVNLLDVNTTQNTRISVIEGVNTTQNTNITYATSLAQAAYNQANTGGLVSNTGIITVDTFTGDGSTVAFTLTVTPVTKNYTSITIDGATQLKSAYTLSGNIITLSEAPLTGENIEVISFTNGVITSYDTVARDIANTATNNITILQGVNTTQNTNITTVSGLAQAAFNKANSTLSLTGGTISGNVTANSFIANTSIYSPTYYSPAASSRLELSDIGLVGIAVAGQTYQFGGSGIESNQGLFGGSFGGNRLSLNNETNLISNRYDTVTISTGTAGYNVNTWNFSNNKIIFPDNTYQNTAFTGTGIDQYARTTSNTATTLAQAAFDKANTGTSGGSSNVTIVTSDSFVGNGSNVAFTLSTTPSSKDYTIITFDGAVQLRSSYSLAANTITFSEAPLNGENVEVTSFSNMPATTTVTINTFTGDGSTVAYTLSVSPSSKDYTFVNFDGTAQLRSSYSLVGNILTFTEAPLVGENIEVTSFTTNSTSSGTTIGKAIAMSIIFGG
jgi:hypothetical protein